MTTPETAQQWKWEPSSLTGYLVYRGDKSAEGNGAFYCESAASATLACEHLNAQAQVLGEVIDALVSVVMHIDDGGMCDCTANAIKLIRQYGKPEDLALLDTLPKGERE